VTQPQPAPFENDDALTWAQVEQELRQLTGFDPATVRGQLKEMEPPEKRQFFRVTYRRGEVILAKGAFSDYVALHLKGVVRLCDDDAVLPDRPACWDNPGPVGRWLQRTRPGRALDRLLPRRRHERELSKPFRVGGLAPPTVDLPGTPLSAREGKEFADRLLGVTSVLWKQASTATLVADNDDQANRCELLLIKRRFLVDVLLLPERNKVRVPTPLYERKFADFARYTLPRVLARNQFFRSLFYVEDVADWDGLRAGLTGKGAREPAAERVGDRLDRKVLTWLETLGTGRSDDAGQYRLVSALNDLLRRPDLYAAGAWPPGALAGEDAERLARGPAKLSANDLSRVNRLLIEAAFPGCFRTVGPFFPQAPEDFEVFAEQLVKAGGPPPLQPLRKRQGEAVYEAGDPADALYLILDGQFRVTQARPGGALVLNHLGPGGFFGEACAEGDGTRRQARVETLTNGVLLRVERGAVLKLAEYFPSFKERLQRERQRARRRDEARAAGRRLPPPEPPPERAGKLMRATNLLVIDMDRCTRCDQCVQACATAHYGQPRFRRANPDLRFGRFEIAGACVHCTDAPCLEECPVGAITFLPEGDVQIHRNRCISCRKCVPACPFGVITMQRATSPEDGASLKKPGEGLVATKCDLCQTPGRDPPCVVACPYGATQRGGLGDFFPGVRGQAVFTDPD
jgi:Fe-S-cluster-containing hydrogenase component 2